MACTFQAATGGIFALLIGLRDEDMDINTMITTHNTAVTDAASGILGKERRRKKTWVTKDVLDLWDERSYLKKKRYEAEEANDKGNLQLYQNYRTISPISHSSKVMLKVILNGLKPQSGEIIAEEQAGFRSGRVTT